MNDTSQKRKFPIGWMIALAIVFASGLFLGQAFSLTKAVTDSETGEVDIAKVLNLYSNTRGDTVDFKQFWETWDMVKNRYVDQPVDDVDLFYGALEGLVQGLDDPYSEYFPPQEAKEFVESLTGEFDGIGAEIGKRDGQLVVIAPIVNSPAERAGIKAGDMIFLIDKEDASGLSIDEAVSKIRGKKGTQVTLTIASKEDVQVREVVITRDTIVIPTIISEMKEGNIAYVRMSTFSDDTTAELQKAVNDLLTKKPKGFILDLRSNPGGYLETAVEVASFWIESGPVVLEGSEKTGQTPLNARGKAHLLSNIPTVVLIDGGSASASEIIAGALQDTKKATIVGQTSFGKGSVQDVQPLPDGSAIKLTIARWYTPNGRQIDKEGIAPDVVVEEMVTTTPKGNGEVEVIDLGLQKALDILAK
jgi:carboxyl-terminal processing protease